MNSIIWNNEKVNQENQKITKRKTTTLDVCSKDAEDNEILQKLMLDISRTAIVGERHTFDCIGLII